MFNWIKKLFPMSVDEKMAILRANDAAFLSWDLTDEQYRKIYGDDDEAIREAKESWFRSGLKVIDEREKMFRWRKRTNPWD